MQHTGVSFFARLFAPAWPHISTTPFDAGVAALDRRRFAEALAHFGTALSEASTPTQRAAVHNKRGLVYVRQGDREAALDAFVDALLADSQFVPVIVNVGNLLLEDGVLDEAIEHYEAALRIDEGYAVAHLNLGVAYKKLGRRSDAVRAFRTASRLEARLRRRRG